MFSRHDAISAFTRHAFDGRSMYVDREPKRYDIYMSPFTSDVPVVRCEAETDRFKTHRTNLSARVRDKDLGWMRRDESHRKSINMHRINAERTRYIHERQSVRHLTQTQQTTRSICIDACDT
jgi:hypothetical protein